MGQALGVKMELDERCKHAEFDRYFSEVICRKYGLPCRVRAPVAGITRNKIPRFQPGHPRPPTVYLPAVGFLCCPNAAHVTFSYLR